VAKKLSWIYATRFDKDMTVDCLQVHLKEVFGDKDFVCEKLVTRHPSYSSFKIGVPMHLVTTMMDDEMWPSGILIGKYFPMRTSKSGGEQRWKNLQEKCGPA
jgi:hypothetical protein